MSGRLLSEEVQLLFRFRVAPIPFVDQVLTVATNADPLGVGHAALFPPYRFGFLAEMTAGEVGGGSSRSLAKHGRPVLH